MIKELIIHLGDHKTGSTSIQTALASRNWTCETCKLIYPTQWNHNPLAKAIKGVNEGLAKKGENLRQRMLSSSADIGVISAEAFENVPPQKLAQFLATYLPELSRSTRLITYIRPHADRLLSSFAERSKIGLRCGTLAQLHRNFLSRGFLAYAPRLRDWRNVFGEQLTLRVFQRNLLHGMDVVDDFYSYVFGAHSFEFSQSPHTNKSLCLEDLVMLREVHQVLRKNFGDRLNNSTQTIFGLHFAILLAQSEVKGTRIQLHRDLVEEMISAYRGDAIQLDQEFFSGSPMLDALEAYSDKAIEEEQSLNPANYYSQETLRQMHCWAEFIGRLMVSNQSQFLANSRPPRPNTGPGGKRRDSRRIRELPQ